MSYLRLLGSPSACVVSGTELQRFLVEATLGANDDRQLARHRHHWTGVVPAVTSALWLIESILTDGCGCCIVQSTREVRGAVKI
jgi:hypothetical protein